MTYHVVATEYNIVRLLPLMLETVKADAPEVVLMYRVGRHVNVENQINL